MAQLGMNKTAAQAMQAVHKIVESLGPGSVVKIGFMEGAMAGYSGPRPLHGKKETAKRANAPGHQVAAAQVAYWNEYGTTRNTVSMASALYGEEMPEQQHIPPRPFFRTMIEKQSPTWGRLAQALLKNTKFSSQLTLQGMGLKIAEQLQMSIVNFKDPGNAESTIERKGFDNPLLDSHNMVNSVEYQVDDNERFHAKQDK